MLFNSKCLVRVTWRVLLSGEVQNLNSFRNGIKSTLFFNLIYSPYQGSSKGEEMCKTRKRTSVLCSVNSKWWEAIFRQGNVNWKAEHLLLWVGCGFAINRLQEIK